MPFIAIPTKLRDRAVELYCQYNKETEEGKYDDAFPKWVGFREAMQMMLPPETYSAIIFDCCCVHDHGETLTDSLPELVLSDPAPGDNAAGTDDTTLKSGE